MYSHSYFRKSIYVYRLKNSNWKAANKIKKDNDLLTNIFLNLY